MSAQQEWKVGDRAVVEILEVPDMIREVKLKLSNDTGWAWVDRDCLSPLPVPSPHAALEAAVVEAAEWWRDSFMGNQGSHATHTDALINRIDDLRAARTPPDPVKALREAFGTLSARYEKAGLSPLASSPEWRQMAEAIALIEKVEKP